MQACRVTAAFKAAPRHSSGGRVIITRRAHVVVRSGSEDDRQMESAFEQELRRRGMGSGSFSEEEAAARAGAPRSPFDQQPAGDRQQQQRGGPRPPPSFRPDDDEVPPQLAKSRALNSEGLEGFLPRAWELLKLGGSFFLAFAPFILAVSLAFAAIYFVFGDAFVHGGSPTASPPPYYDPDLLLAEPTADPMVPLDLR
ncbi:hypothetical protein ABPG77_000630 [Micractinium sp. CCAP 211/92]